MRLRTDLACVAIHAEIATAYFACGSIRAALQCGAARELAINGTNALAAAEAAVLVVTRAVPALTELAPRRQIHATSKAVVDEVGATMRQAAGADVRPPSQNYFS